MDEPAQPVFDEYGYLTPPGPHKGSLCHIRLHFVEGMFPSESRPQLFRVMLGIIRKFISLLNIPQQEYRLSEKAVPPFRGKCTAYPPRCTAHSLGYDVKII